VGDFQVAIRAIFKLNLFSIQKKCITHSAYPLGKIFSYSSFYPFQAGETL